MSSKLDQSLDTIMSEAGGARGGRRGRDRRRGARAAPVGGVRKSTRAAAITANARNTTKPATKAAAAAPATAGSSKVLVSNLPHDVPESDIKEFFTKVAGPIRKVILQYGPTGQSRGIATIIFGHPSSGAKALKQNGTVVDKRALRIEAIMDATAAANPTNKSLSERVSTPNSQPKRATADKARPAKESAGAARAGKTAAATRGRTARGPRQSRPKKKTAAELDDEMTDYFGGHPVGEAAAAPAAASGAAAPAPAATAAPAGDDLGMDDIS